MAKTLFRFGMLERGGGWSRGRVRVMGYCSGVSDSVRHSSTSDQGMLLKERHGSVLVLDTSFPNDQPTLFDLIDLCDFTSIASAGPCRWTAPEIMYPPEDGDLTDPLTIESDNYVFLTTVTKVLSSHFYPNHISL